jgi:predicted AlkP superfamily phosphohydrolase/phosphomutase
MILVLALDALDPDLMERFAAEGRLPHLSRLAEQGLSGRLRSSFPPVSVPAWSTFLCGAGPGRHGLFDFTVLEHGVGGRPRVRFQNGADRAVPTLLDLLDRAGRRVCSIGLPTTYPAPPLHHGAVLAGFDSPLVGRPDPRAMHPPQLWRRLRAEGLDLRTSTLPEGRKGSGWHERAAAQLLASIERRLAQTLRLLALGPWDLVLAHFQAADTAGHHFMRYFDETSERHDAEHPERARVLGDVYAALDSAVGRLDAALPDEALRIIVSDHGMGPASGCVIHLNRWLEQEGFLVRRAPGLRDAEVERLRRGALRYLPRELGAPLFRLLRRGPAASLESAFRFASLDLEQSAAFSEESSTLPGIWVLDPTARERLIARLRAWDAVVRVHRRHDLYRGAQAGRAPDLLLELRHGLVKTPAGYAGPAVRRLSGAELDGERGAGLNGVHRPEGVLIASGPDLVRHGELWSAWIGDLAPSLLARLAVPIPAWMEGRAIPELGGKPEWSEEPPPPAPIDPPGLTQAQAARVERRLRALGYLG